MLINLNAFFWFVFALTEENLCEVIRECYNDGEHVYGGVPRISGDPQGPATRPSQTLVGTPYLVSFLLRHFKAFYVKSRHAQLPIICVIDSFMHSSFMHSH